MQTISDTTPTENLTRFLCFVFFFFDWLNLKHLFHENHYWGKELSLSFFSGCWTYFSSEIAFFSLICLEKISKGVFYSQDVDLYIVLENIKNQYHCIFFYFKFIKWIHASCLHSYIIMCIKFICLSLIKTKYAIFRIIQKSSWNFDFFIYFKQYIVKEYINKHAEVWSHDSIYQQELIVWNKRIFPLAYGYMQFLIVITIPLKVKLRCLMIYETKQKCIFSYKSGNIRKRISLRVIFY